MKFKQILPSFAIALTLIFFAYSWIVQRQNYYTPPYDPVNLRPILSKAVMDEADYKLIYEQTGIARPIVDELKESPQFKEKMIKFQKNYLSQPHIVSSPMNLFTREDIIKSSNNEPIPGFEMAPYQKGYIFLTKSTYTMGWRHGHAGIVIDAKRGKTLEALSPGTMSMEQDIDKWRYYATFKMMRPKEVDQAELDRIADYAGELLRNLPYHIFADKNQGPFPYETHCSLLVWQAYKAFGFDLDPKGELLVSPADLASSPLLETLQIYGFDPNKDW